MTKYCTKCGSPNPDDARFCSACGTPLTFGAQVGGSTTQTQSQVSTQPQQPQTPPSKPTPQGYQQSRPERALNIFTKNLGLILPLLVLLVVDVIIFLIVGAIMFTAFLHGGFPGPVFYTPIYYAGFLATVLGFLFWLLVGVFLSIVVVEARNAASGVGYSLSQAWREVRSRLSDVVIIAVVLGVVDGVLGFIPLAGWLFESLFFAYIVVAEGLMFTQNVSAFTALSRALGWVTSMADKDPLTLVVLVVASILSELPIINFFAVPYAALVVFVYFFDNGVQSLGPPVAPASQI
ncbi:MAG: zinc ribbon domain-containing protein [Thermoprotei archaeon]